MENDEPGQFDLADFDVTPPPEGWVPEVTNALPFPADVIDYDKESSS